MIKVHNNMIISTLSTTNTSGRLEHSVHIVTIKHNKFPNTELKYIVLYDETKDSLTPGHFKSLHKFGVHSACSAQCTPTLQ